MTYYTVEAYMENNKIALPKDFESPSKKVKVLITFIDNDIIDHDIHQLERKHVSEEILNLSDKVLKKNKSLLTNI